MIGQDALAIILMRMFEFSPVAMSISTTGADSSRYVMVNRAYLDLTGRRWEELNERSMVDHGAAIASPARDRRLRLLEEVGSYKSELAEIRHADGRIIPVLISAQRSHIGDAVYDIELIADVTEHMESQIQRERELTYAALTDPLTGLLNRAGIDAVLQERLARVWGEGQCVAVAFIDLNGFKQINDRLGHEAGDTILRRLAARLRLACGQEEIVARIGGDEFMLVLTVPHGAVGSIPPMLAGIAAAVFTPVDLSGSLPVPIGAAIGISVQQVPDVAAAVLIREADRQMYRAKSTGEPISIRFGGGERVWADGVA
ncbi:diguanylate cyclase domain-containing protein [Ancylobacter lacus]|uniref:diguanylate cyclase domain-containing protein n=1 Tax=Ancylobacter lacus TaxID=2579970 RepID=UPI001BCB2FAA|nr:diguanylate cyclase [Ancylobacter lacus]MBS7540415.1 diguanylate cyclase [Ancylobacter lacus]